MLGTWQKRSCQDSNYKSDDETPNYAEDIHVVITFPIRNV